MRPVIVKVRVLASCVIFMVGVCRQRRSHTSLNSGMKKPRRRSDNRGLLWVRNDQAPLGGSGSFSGITSSGS